MTRLLFVYGSLKRGLPNHALLSGQSFVAEARTAPAYALVCVDAYPALIPGGQRSIEGELYRVTPARLAELDAFEGYDYVRAAIELSDGQLAEAYIAAPTARARAASIDADTWRG